MNFDRFSDPDSLSFNSLSRSSSLIQFESLERQIQTGDTQSFGGSTPSLNNTNTMHDAHARADAKNTEHTTTLNSARNYFDIEKIDFNSALYLNCQEQTSSSESSCSTDNSIYYSDHQQDGDTSAKETQFHNQRSAHQAAVKLAFRRKNSVENLSEDSGYGELPSFKCRSKSIPNLNKDQLMLLGIDDTLDNNHRSLNDINKRSPAKAAHNGEATGAQADIQHDCQNSSFGVGMMGRSKINTNHDGMRSAEHAISSLDTSKNSPNEIGWCTDNHPHVFDAQAATNDGRTGVSCADEVSSVHIKNSTSLPDIFAHFASDYGNLVFR